MLREQCEPAAVAGEKDLIDVDISAPAGIIETEPQEITRRFLDFAFGDG